ncbi:mitoguardin isoform X4 [Amblyomma americanum]
MLQVTPRLSFPVSEAPRRSKIIIASAGIGIILLGVLTRYLRRRFVDFKSAVANGEVTHVVWCSRCGGGRGPLRALPLGSAMDRASATQLGPQQLSTMGVCGLPSSPGLDSLDQALHCWEQALQQLRPEDPAAGALAASLQSLLADGRWLRSQGRLLAEGTIDAVLLPQLSADVPPRPASTADTESFVSAEGTSDVAVLSELSTVPPADQCALYREALELLDREGIPCRSDRAEVVRCSSKQDYLAKIHCIRLAFKRLTGQPDVLEWLIDAANHVLGGFMLCAGKDPKDALHAYRELVAYLLDSSHHDQVVLELRNKGVVCATVYDVVIDYVLLDAFEDLSSPPQPVVAVIQNRWLTAGFKETALSAAIWSLFKAKKRLLPFSGGFFAHYYALMEQVVPVLAWGFLGSDVDLKEMCSFFKDEVEALVCDMFDPSRSRYTSVDDLALDILRNSQLHYNRVCQALAGALLPEPAPP